MAKPEDGPLSHLARRTPGRSVTSHAAFFMASLGLGLFTAAPAVAQSREVFVVEKSDSSIRVFDALAAGNTLPLRVIQGGLTGMVAPRSIQFDSLNREIVVANTGNNSITVYAQAASGNAAPLRRIAGASTGLSLSGSTGLFVDPIHDEIGIVNTTGGFANLSVAIFSRLANGDVAPLRTIQGPATGFSSWSSGLDLDTLNDEIFVGDWCKVVVFPRTASGNVAPVRSFAFTVGNNNCPYMADVKSDPWENELLVTSSTYSPTTVYVVPLDASGSTSVLRSLGAGSLFTPLRPTVDPVNREIFGAMSTNLNVWSPTVFLRQITGATANPASTAVGPLAMLSIGDAYQVEGNTGSSVLSFTVRLWAARAQTVTVDYATANGTAGAADYPATSGTLTFAPGVTSQTISVPILGDTTQESNETVLVNLSNATGTVLANRKGVGTILDDDAPVPDPATVYRLRHPAIGAYLFTVYPYERDSAALQYGYIYEGVCCKWSISPAGDGRTELFRLFSGTAGEYFFTIFPSERDSAVATYGYRYEGVAAYCNPSPTAAAPTPWYRMRYGNKHIYTIYSSEVASAQALGWVLEGISCYLPSP